MSSTRFFLMMLLFSSQYLMAQSQRYFTKAGEIVFDADGPLDDVEKIHAKSTTASCVVDVATGQIEWAVPIKSFKFENSLMEEHFNENYLESEKFPKATFKGTIQNTQAVKWTSDGSYPVKVQGKLTIHGVTKDISTSGTITVKGAQIQASAAMKVALEDYRIKIPSVVGFKIAKEASVQIQANLEQLKQSNS